MAATAIPPLPAVTFQCFYEESANNPYNGNYAVVMQTFRDVAQPNEAAALYNIVSALEEQNSGVYLGIFEDPNQECGLSLTLHGVKRFPLTLGRPTQWDNKTFAFIQDVVATKVQSVEVDASYFDRTRDVAYTTIPATVARVDKLWQASPDDELLGPFPDNDANTRQCRTRRLMYVPPKFAPVILNRRLTSRQLWSKLGATIIEAGADDACKELMDRIVLAGCRLGAAAPSSLVLPMPRPPLADATLITHRRSLLLRLLPGLAIATVPNTMSDPNTARLADYVGQLVSERQDARADTLRGQA